MTKWIKRKIIRIQEDSHMQEVIQGTSVAFVLKIIGVILTFVLNVILARLLGAEGIGIYYLAFSIVAIASVIGKIGLDIAMLRFISFYAALKNWDCVYQVYILGMRWAIVASMAVSALVFIASHWLAVWQHKPELAVPLRWMALSIVPFVLLNLNAESLKGIKKVQGAMLIQAVGVPLVYMIIIFPSVFFSGIMGAAMSYSISSFLVMLASFLFWRKAFSYNGPVESWMINSIELLKSSRNSLVSVIIGQAVVPYMPVFLLGFWASEDEVGVFSVVMRVAMLLNFILVTANVVLAPKFSELYATKNLRKMEDVFRKSTLMIFIFSCPIIILFTFFGDDVLGVFGLRFQEGEIILRILVFGQLINLLSGPMGSLLMMTGYEKLNMKINVVSSLLLVIMVLSFAPFYLGVGVAMAVSVSVAFKNLVSIYFVYKFLGVSIIPWRKAAYAIDE